MDNKILRALDKTDLEQAVEVASKAFMEDPLWVYLYPNLKRREKYSLRFFKAILSYSIDKGQAYGIGTPVKAVALWKKYDSEKVLKEEKKKRISVRTFMGMSRMILSRFTYSFIRLRKLMEDIYYMRRFFAPNLHHYLHMLCVHPSEQGKGHGKTILKALLERGDKEGAPFYLETFTPTNVTFYQHMGFQCVKHMKYEETGLEVWAFLQE